MNELTNLSFGDTFNFCDRGWECPKCGRVYSPTTSMCYYCGNGTKTTTPNTTPPSTGNPYPFGYTEVTCGTPSSGCGGNCSCNTTPKTSLSQKSGSSVTSSKLGNSTSKPTTTTTGSPNVVGVKTAPTTRVDVKGFDAKNSESELSELLNEVLFGGKRNSSSRF